MDITALSKEELLLLHSTVKAEIVVREAILEKEREEKLRALNTRLSDLITEYIELGETTVKINYNTVTIK